MKDKKWYLLSGVVLVIALGIAGVSFYGNEKSSLLNNSTNNQQSPEPVSSFKWINGLDAKPGLDAELARHRLIAVMVENHPDARPQSGLSQAEIVFEVVAEGGITRHLAFFQQEGVEVGPVRSARTYFADLANMWPSLYLHVGGSPEVLTNISAQKYPNIVDFNEYYNGKYFTRVKSRSAPHNVYTNTKDIFDYLHDFNLELVEAPLVFHAEFSDNLPEGVPIQALEVNFSKPAFLVSFTYDPAQKKYQRSVAGKPDIDSGNSEVVAPSTVLVLETKMDEVPGDEEGRMKVTTIGSGELKVFSGGIMQSGAWARKSGEPFSFFDEFQRPIKVLPGQVWVALVESFDEQVTFH